MPTNPIDERPNARIAIIGSGPSGCYLAQTLLRSAPGSEITIFDRLTSPYGLIRYGVAADHQHTKAITRQFERLFSDPAVRFAGAVEIGPDLSLDQIRAQFDVVALATGLTQDRPLGVPGAELEGVFGAGTITRTLNAHPDERPELPSFGSDVVLVGGGNVALDVLRFLVKDADGYAESDVADHALDRYLAQPAERVTVLVRSSAAEMKSDPQMLRELAALPRARYVSVAPLPETPLDADRTTTARLAALAELFDPARPVHPGPEVTFRFESIPSSIVGSERVEEVVLGLPGSADSEERIPADAVITAIGFTRDPDAPFALHLSDDAESGRIEPGLYRTGWAKRGPRGAIPENRACAKEVAAEIAADLSTGLVTPSPERLGFAGLPEQVILGSVSYAQWMQLDSHERQSAPEGRARQKSPDHQHMHSIAHGTHAEPPTPPTKGSSL